MRSPAKLGERLLGAGLIDEDHLKLALDHQTRTGTFLGETLIELGYVEPMDIAATLADLIRFPFVDLAEEEIDTSLAHKVGETFSRRKHAIPYKEDDAGVHVAMADPLDLSAQDHLRDALRKRVIPHLAFRPDVERAISLAFDVRHKAAVLLQEMPEHTLARDLSVDDLADLAEDAPIVKLVHSILQGGIQNAASDIHIEPREDIVRVRYRIDGLLYEQMTLTRGVLPACVSRLKIMSNLNIAERRRPQDGRFSLADDRGIPYDVRVSMMPTVFGEKVVLRLLEKQSSLSSLPQLGFTPPQLEQYESFVRRPHGIVLLSGPTGSGKSTTLYATLGAIGSSTININTIEDPVEYNILGANQIQVNTKIGVTFASGLRTLLRQDPDVIMVGEIRDKETAEIAIQAALTGHLVLSTLHTNDAPGALVRLQNMGVEPYLVSSALLGVAAQRLVRTICLNCKVEAVPDLTLLKSIGLEAPEAIKSLWVGSGCGKCGHRGMRGRSAVFEVMPMSDDLREMVLSGASGATLFDQARREGMKTIRESGIEKALTGVTTPEEVLRVLFAE